MISVPTVKESDLFVILPVKSIEKLLVLLAERIGLVFLPSVPRAEKNIVLHA